jgi:hypothetical protein
MFDAYHSRETVWYAIVFAAMTTKKKKKKKKETSATD